MIRLVQMTQDDYDAYYPAALQDLANELARARDLMPLEGVEAAKKSFDELFPGGKVGGKDQFIFKIANESGPVGVLHFGVRRDRIKPDVYVWSIEIEPEHRGRGYGRAAMTAVEQKARELGVSNVSLNVFGHNDPAISLYKGLGYRPVAMTMRKSVVEQL